MSHLVPEEFQVANTLALKYDGVREDENGSSITPDGHNHS